MAEAYKCDICGCFFIPGQINKFNNLLLRYSRYHTNEKEIFEADVCPTCEKIITECIQKIGGDLQ